MIYFQLKLLTEFFPPVCFRELCALCWMLHVRDQLSISCRKYQAARQHGGDEQVFHVCLIVCYLYIYIYKNVYNILRHINISACFCVPQIPASSEVISTCIDALCWARRFLPFSRFLNAEEILQDILLSLMSELPPLSLVTFSYFFLHIQCLLK